MLKILLQGALPLSVFKKSLKYSFLLISVGLSFPNNGASSTATIVEAEDWQSRVHEQAVELEEHHVAEALNLVQRLQTLHKESKKELSSDQYGKLLESGGISHEGFSGIAKLKVLDMGEDRRAESLKKPLLLTTFSDWGESGLNVLFVDPQDYHRDSSYFALYVMELLTVDYVNSSRTEMGRDLLILPANWKDLEDVEESLRMQEGNYYIEKPKNSSIFKNEDGKSTLVPQLKNLKMTRARLKTMIMKPNLQNLTSGVLPTALRTGFGAAVGYANYLFDKSNGVSETEIMGPLIPVAVGIATSTLIGWNVHTYFNLTSTGSIKRRFAWSMSVSLFYAFSVKVFGGDASDLVQAIVLTEIFTNSIIRNFLKTILDNFSVARKEANLTNHDFSLFGHRFTGVKAAYMEKQFVSGGISYTLGLADLISKTRYELVGPVEVGPVRIAYVNAIPFFEFFNLHYFESLVAKAKLDPEWAQGVDISNLQAIAEASRARWEWKKQNLTKLVKNPNETFKRLLNWSLFKDSEGRSKKEREVIETQVKQLSGEAMSRLLYESDDQSSMHELAEQALRDFFTKVIKTLNEYESIHIDVDSVSQLSQDDFLKLIFNNDSLNRFDDAYFNSAQLLELEERIDRVSSQSEENEHVGTILKTGLLQTMVYARSKLPVLEIEYFQRHPKLSLESVLASRSEREAYEAYLLKNLNFEYLSLAKLLECLQRFEQGEVVFNFQSNEKNPLMALSRELNFNQTILREKYQERLSQWTYMYSAQSKLPVAQTFVEEQLREKSFLKSLNDFEKKLKNKFSNDSLDFSMALREIEHVRDIYSYWWGSFYGKEKLFQSMKKEDVLSVLAFQDFVNTFEARWIEVSGDLANKNMNSFPWTWSRKSSVAIPMMFYPAVGRAGKGFAQVFNFVVRSLGSGVDLGLNVGTLGTIRLLDLKNYVKMLKADGDQLAEKKAKKKSKPDSVNNQSSKKQNKKSWSRCLKSLKAVSVAN